MALTSSSESEVRSSEVLVAETESAGREAVVPSGRGVRDAGPANPLKWPKGQEVAQTTPLDTGTRNQSPSFISPLSVEKQRYNDQPHIQPHADRKGLHSEVLAQDRSQNQPPQHGVTGIDDNPQKGVPLLGGKFPHRDSSISKSTIPLVLNQPTAGLEEGGSKVGEAVAALQALRQPFATAYDARITQAVEQLQTGLAGEAQATVEKQLEELKNLHRISEDKPFYRRWGAVLALLKEINAPPQGRTSGLEEQNRREFIQALTAGMASLSGVGEALGSLVNGFGWVARASVREAASSPGSPGWKAHRTEFLELARGLTGAGDARRKLEIEGVLGEFDTKLMLVGVGTDRGFFSQGIMNRVRRSYRILGQVYDRGQGLLDHLSGDSEKRRQFIGRLRGVASQSMISLEDGQLTQGIAWAAHRVAREIRWEQAKLVGRLDRLLQSVMGQAVVEEKTPEALSRPSRNERRISLEEAQRYLEEVAATLLPGQVWHVVSDSAVKRYPGLRVLTQKVPWILPDDESHTQAILRLMEEVTPIGGIHYHGTREEIEAVHRGLFSEPRPIRELTKGQWVPHPLEGLPFRRFLKESFDGLPRAEGAPAIDWDRLARALSLLSGT